VCYDIPVFLTGKFNMKELLVTNEMTTTSLIIAEHFGKAHKDVLRSIDKLGIDDEFGRRNFTPSEFMNAQSKLYRGYIITRDGFSILAMSFTGEKALKWKKSFLQAFNAMERALINQQKTVDWKAARLQGKTVRKNTTDTIQDFVEYATRQGSKNAKMYYANITKMEYKALDILEQSKQVTGNFRDTLDLMQIGFLQVAENIASLAMKKGMIDGLDYHDIYTLAKQKVSEYALSVSWVLLSQNE
jgi:Rha family phage regulatory protein